MGSKIKAPTSLSPLDHDSNIRQCCQGPWPRTSAPTLPPALESPWPRESSETNPEPDAMNCKACLLFSSALSRGDQVVRCCARCCMCWRSARARKVVFQGLFCAVSLSSSGGPRLVAGKICMKMTGPQTRPCSVTRKAALASSDFPYMGKRGGQEQPFMNSREHVAVRKD